MSEEVPRRREKSRNDRYKFPAGSIHEGNSYLFALLQSRPASIRSKSVDSEESLADKPGTVAKASSSFLSPWLRAAALLPAFPLWRGRRRL